MWHILHDNLPGFFQQMNDILKDMWGQGGGGEDVVQ